MYLDRTFVFIHHYACSSEGQGCPLLRAANECWFIWSICFVWLIGLEIHPEEPDRPERPANQTDEPERVARAQKIMQEYDRTHPRLAVSSVPLLEWMTLRGSMPFSIRPFRRFSVQCDVTYHVGPCIDATMTARGHDRV